MKGKELEVAMRDLRRLCHGAPEVAPVYWADDSVARIAVLAHEAGLRVSDFPTLDQFFAAVEAFADKRQSET